jgi:putative ABC transport system permease protein
VLDAVVAVVAVAAALAVGLAVFLSLQLRRREMETAFRLGGRRATVARLVATESVILLCLAFILALAILTATEGAMAPLAASLVAAV